ncbi:MAG: hypothetical protein V3U92_04040 [Cellulophaga sp.]
MKEIKYVCVAMLGFYLLQSCGSVEKEEVVQVVASPAGNQSSLPFLFSKNNSTLMSWVEVVDSISTLKYSELKGEKWSSPKDIISGNDWFVNWADFPMIAENNGNLLTHVLKKSAPETFSYDVKINVFNKANSSWKTDILLHKDSINAEHGFVSALPYKKDSFFITWLDGRNTASEGGGHGEHKGAMSVRAAEVTVNGEITNSVMLDDKTCDCCQTTALITKNGPIVIYRDRSDEEVRDMSIVRLVDGKWTTPTPIYNDKWKIEGCPVNGPKVAGIENNIAVAWFTVVESKPVVKVLFSKDGGANFEVPTTIDDKTALGRVDIVMLNNDTALISWMATSEKKAEVKAVKVTASGEIGIPVVITTLSASRKTGFPQMELVKDKVLFAWTSVEDKESVVKTVFVALDEF